MFERQTQRQGIVTEQPIRPREPWLAVLLSVCPGLGQHYAGHIYRGIAVYVVLIIVSWLAAIAFMFVESRISIVFLATPFVGFAAIVFDAWRCAARQDKAYRLKWFNRLWIYAGVTLVLIVTVNPLMDLIVGRHIVRAYFMLSSTMQPTVLHHDLLLVNKLSRPGRGDIALIDLSAGRRPAQLTEIIDDQLIRRVVAVGGDTVELRGRQLLVNGEPQTEPYVRWGGVHLSTLNDAHYRFGPQSVPLGHYFLLADNRGSGIDSRVLGFVPQAHIGGKVTKVFWSWNFDEGTVKWHRTALSLSRERP